MKILYHLTMRKYPILYLLCQIFFYSYPLPEFREYVKALLLMACSDPDCNAAFNIILCEDIIRVVESCHIISQINHGRDKGQTMDYIKDKRASL